MHSICVVGTLADAVSVGSAAPRIRAKQYRAVRWTAESKNLDESIKKREQRALQSLTCAAPHR
jgi:hypothetical protein